MLPPELPSALDVLLSGVSLVAPVEASEPVLPTVVSVGSDALESSPPPAVPPHAVINTKSQEQERRRVRNIGNLKLDTGIRGSSECALTWVLRRSPLTDRGTRRRLELPMSEKPATKGRRLFKLASMTAQVAGGYAKNRIKSVFQSDEASEADRTHMYEKSGEVIAKTLGELKGAVMKVGQMASVAADMLPKEVQDALTSLQREAPPMPFDVIADQIESEFSAAPETLYRSFERVPFASASIGQVHRAVTDDGREVVVKVQYPGVDNAVDSDLAHLKLALRASGMVRVPKKSLDAVFEELKARLHEELDYTNEASNVRLFQEFHARHPFVKIPDVVGERSSARVLTLTFEPGDAIRTLDEKGYTQDERDAIGRGLFTVMVSQIFEFGAIHGDPNPGNFAFRKDGTVVIYDFGCVKHLPVEIVEAYRDTMMFGLEEDYAKVDDALLRLGIRNPKASPVEPEFYKRWRDIFTHPFEGLPDDIFDYSTATIHDELVKLIPSAMRKLTSFQPAKQMIFLDRMVAGHYGNLREIRARVPVLPTVLEYANKLEPASLAGAVQPQPA